MPCAAPLAAAPLPGDPGDRDCPACGDQKLFARHLPEYRLNVGECRNLRRVVDQLGEFQTLLYAEAEAERPPPAASRPVRAYRTSAVAYRRCARLWRTHAPPQFGGVIIDLCGQHGVWFDDEDLSRLLIAAPRRRTAEDLGGHGKLDRLAGAQGARPSVADIDRRLADEGFYKPQDSSLLMMALGRLVARLSRF